MSSVARFLLSMILILFALSAAVAARAANSLQKSTEYQAAGVQNQSDQALTNIRQYCAASLGQGYSLSVQKTYNGGYLFICVQKDSGKKE